MLTALTVSTPGVGPAHAQRESTLLDPKNLTVFDPETLAPYEGFLITDVKITGVKVTKPFVVRREIHFDAGDDFSVVQLRGDMTRLENLGIFSSTRVTATPTDSTVVLLYEVKEMPWIVPYPKFRYTEQDGWSFGVGVASINFMGRAIYASGLVLAGGQDNYVFSFNYPWITGNHISLSASYSDLKRDDKLNEFREHSREFTPWTGFWVGQTGRLLGTVSYFQMNSDVDGITLTDDRRDELLRFGLKVGYDTRDAWRNPCSGWMNELFVQWHDGGPFGDPAQWLLTEFDVRRYSTVAPRHSINVGGLLSMQNGTVGEDIPGYMQYRMGGANSIRGYEIETLGKELYGRNQFIATAEYEYLLMPLREYRWKGISASLGLETVVFADWGVAWDHSNEFNRDRGRLGYGVGLHFLIPAVFVIRTDIGFSENGDAVFHLGINEKFTAQRNRLR